MRAALYLRQSIDRNGDGAAVDRQETECRELAARLGADVTGVYCDNDQSATNGTRPEWRRLLADLAEDRYDALLCWHTDRLYRRLRDLVDLLEIAEQHKLRIASVKAGDIDLSTASGRMVASMLGNVASYETAHKSERQRSANAQRAKAGDIGWTRRPYGYRLDDAGRIVIDRTEAAEIRKAAKRVLAGATVQSVVDEMNTRGVRTAIDLHGCDASDDECRKQPAKKCPKVRHGGPWNVTGLRRVLTNPRTAGRAVSLGVDYGKAPWPAILAADVADRLAALFADPRRRSAPASLAVKYLLSGLAICGRCGERMFATPSTGGRMLYRCGSTHLSRGLADVDNLLTETVIARLSRKDAVRLFVADVDLDALRGRAVELRERRDGLAGLLADGLLDVAAVKVQARKLTDEISELARQIAAATSSPLAAVAGTPDVRAAWHALTLTQQRGILDTLLTVTILPAGKGIGFDPAQVKIDWRPAS
jgi:site-specific DNA recombinase